MREAALYVHDGRVSTSAGVSAGIDLSLSLVEQHRGPELAAAVARELVLYLRRDGDTAQISPFLRYRDHRAVPKDRITVAVVVSNEGSVATDVLAPYQVFAESEKFFIYTVAAERRVSPLSGGAHLLPDHTLTEVKRGTLPEPDVVVVPAVTDPVDVKEARTRQWIAERHHKGACVLGVCAGSELLAASGLLDGHDATSFWSGISSLKRHYPQVHWKRGQRYVEDGRVTTTAGITSGTVGALRVVEELAGKDEAARIGKTLSYPGWTLDGPTAIPANQLAIGDVPYALNAAFPWLRPTVGIGLVDGVGEIDAAAAFEAYAGVSFTARTVVLGARDTITTRHGLVLIAETARGGAHGVDRFAVPGVAGTSAVDTPLRTWARRNGLAVELPGGGRREGSSVSTRSCATSPSTATSVRPWSRRSSPNTPRPIWS
ncbi:DJ-1/PfpI family protein [Streptomyces sp. NPDC057565]|uniref:DJ-1/PfpI family protein n=1 Tax=Streptomyces sp. NPDC057565 TaxID=3346169 RepID=UPI003692B623